MFDFENFANLVMEHTNVVIEAEFFDNEDEETQQGAIIILDQATGEAVNSKHYLTLEELNEFLDDLYHHLEESILVWGDDANHMHLNTLLELLVSEVENIG